MGHIYTYMYIYKLYSLIDMRQISTIENLFHLIDEIDCIYTQTLSLDIQKKKGCCFLKYLKSEAIPGTQSLVRKGIFYCNF